MSEANKILIIDDEEGAGQELTEILEGEGYDALVANNGEQAKAIIAKTPLDLVLLDLKLPDVNGLDLVKNIRETGRDTYIIIITAYGSLDSAKRALREDIYDYITKPFKPEKLLEIIKKALTMQLVERKLREKVAALERFQKIATGRELEIIKLKDEIKGLKKEIGK